jgi:processive 1,2-diacylglycerol beta-glucosyltransferase
LSNKNCRRVLVCHTPEKASRRVSASAGRISHLSVGGQTRNFALLGFCYIRLPDRTMKKRVLIMSTSAGTGHVRAGDALTKVFEEDPGVSEVLHTDALRFTNKLFRDFYSKLYTRLVKDAPDFLGWWYKQSDEPWKTDGMRLMLDRLNTGPLVKFIRQFNPHITVCTHFMPAGIISHLIAKNLLDAHLSIVVTDLDFHAMWLSRVFHRYFVAIEETKIHLEELGLPKERITVSGIPIDPEYITPIDRVATRFLYGLHPTRPTLLLSAGALGNGPTEFIVERLKNLRSKAQTIVLCGRNPETRERVLKVVGEHNENFKVFGYTGRMPDLMKISDLFIGKPGGLTTAEALACGLPMVIISPIPGQEERNSDHLLEDGVAVKCNEMTTIPYKIDTLLDDPLRLEQMRRKAFAISRPEAAKTIVETLVADELSALEVSDDEAEAITIAASKERDNKR